MNEYGLTKNEISKKLNSLLSTDETFDSGKIIGSMCTKPDSYSQSIYSKFLEKNIGDPGLFKGTLLLEKQIIRFWRRIGRRKAIFLFQDSSVRFHSAHSS